MGAVGGGDGNENRNICHLPN